MTYFVIFRLADSLPANVLEAYRFEREDIVRTAEALGRTLTPYDVGRLRQLYDEKIESSLDAGTGACYLAQTEVAKIIGGNLFHFDGSRYHLVAWCIMPNHVHVVMRPLSGHALATIVHSWKSYTAKEANRVLGRTGAFWQREYYDHLVRDEADHYRVVEYVLGNPMAAGLADWPWVGHTESRVMPD